MPNVLNEKGEYDISSCTRPGINHSVPMETKMLKKLLDDIVAENIGGQLVHPHYFIPGQVKRKAGHRRIDHKFIK